MKKAKRPPVRKAASKKRKPVMRHGRDGVRAVSKRAARPAAPRTPATNLKRQYLDMFAREFPTTLKVMKAHPSGHDEFRPHERSSSALRLVYTFMMENGAGIKAVRGELTMPPERPPMPATYAEAVASYERGARELIAAAEKMPESRLSEKVNFGPLAMIPVGELLWFLLLDSIHHRGQLSVYVRMAGGKVPSIYGPSADEPWT